MAFMCTSSTVNPHHHLFSVPKQILVGDIARGPAGILCSMPGDWLPHHPTTGS